MKKACNGRNLGLPMVIGKSKNQVFGFLKSCVTSKLQGLRGRQEGITEGSGNGPTKLHNVLFQIAKRNMQGHL